ncbi:hypothetical protein [Chryseobacterium koreense]|uniref:hypothetical protein n=1 Tax=Chryseobacterium koreense TaxID=232216 RepID=UPI0026F220C6|nr:hypothetical protein [Chryseobacterium koreense]
MKKKFLIATLAVGCCVFFNAQNCVTGCNDNTYLNSIGKDPNTLEYDNMVSTYHASLIKEVDGTVKVWGQLTAANGTANVLTPLAVTTASYAYTGTILKIAAASGGSGASEQFAILTTDGLYLWGAAGVLVKNTAYTKNTAAFGKMAATATGTNSYGLPTGVNPADVKMLFGSSGTLGIVTCSGAAWILSFTGNKNGDGTSQNSGTNANNTDVVWHRISTASGVPLTNVVAMRGTANAMMALTSTEDLYTWGTNIYDGASTVASQQYAKKMTLPAGMTGKPKMIGMTVGNSYYLLTTTGELWSLGNNASRQLGDFTTTNRTSWVRVKKSAAANMDPVAWISPQEHDSGFGVINILTTNGKLYSWGDNQGNMLGAGSGATDPIYMMGGLDANDKLIAVETGGHTSMVIRQCSKKYGYVGHRTAGSMGDGQSASANEIVFNFTNTAEVTLCGAPTNPVAITQDLKFCEGTVYANLANAIFGSTAPIGMTIKWYTSINRAPGTAVTDPANVDIAGALGKTFYAFYEPADGSNCGTPSPSKPITISYYTAGEPGSENCYCTKPGSALTGGSPTQFGITNHTKLANWPEALPNGFIAMESRTDGFVITRVAGSSSITAPKKGMLIYDIAAACVKLYNGTAWNCIQRSCNE